MAYVANTWNSPIDIKSTDKVIDTATNLQTIVSDDPASIKNYLNGEMYRVETFINQNNDDIQIMKEITGSVTLHRYDKRLASLDIQQMNYDTNDTLIEVVYVGDDNATVYYRDKMTYNTDGTLGRVDHYYGTPDLVTRSANTALTYDSNALLISNTYSEG